MHTRGCRNYKINVQPIRVPFIRNLKTRRNKSDTLKSLIICYLLKRNILYTSVCLEIGIIKNIISNNVANVTIYST